MIKSAKILIAAIVLGLLGTIFVAIPSVSAADLTFSTSKINAVEDEIFGVSIGINANGVANYTTKIELSYPADLMEVTSFSFANDWMPLIQHGYGLIDNTEGIIIKTAGYAGGFSTVKTFGKAYFRAKKNGTGIITVNEDSISLGASNENLLSDTFPAITVVIASPKTMSILIEEKEELENKLEALEKQLQEEPEEKLKEELEKEFKELKTMEEALKEEIEKESEEKPKQLFDINLEIDDTKVTDIEELTSRVIFVNFGEAPTSVNLIYTITDESGELVHIEEDEVVVETEKVINKKFIGLYLAPGEYAVALKTIYDVDVEDEFIQDFVIAERTEITNIFASVWFWALLLIFIIYGKYYYYKKTAK